MADSSQTWAKVCHFMQQRCSVVLRADQSYLLDSRLSSAAKMHRFGGIDAFVDAAITAQPSSILANALIDAMTTHESYFFRDDSFWKFLEEVAVPALSKTCPQGLTIWSAACSIGQEAYSLAMLLEEKWPALAAKTSILATDVSAEAVATAERGIYNTTEVNRGLNALRLVRNFTQVAGGFEVKQNLRKKVKFATANLVNSSSATNDFDLILCRNVLIYFNESDKKAVLRQLTQRLRPRGFLGLGTSERCDLPALQPGWHQKP